MGTMLFWTLLAVGLLLAGLALNDIIEQRESSYTVIMSTVAFFLLLAAVHLWDRL